MVPHSLEPWFSLHRRHLLHRHLARIRPAHIATFIDTINLRTFKISVSEISIGKISTMKINIATIGVMKNNLTPHSAATHEPRRDQENFQVPDAQGTDEF